VPTAGVNRLIGLGDRLIRMLFDRDKKSVSLMQNSFVDRLLATKCFLLTKYGNAVFSPCSSNNVAAGNDPFTVPYLAVTVPFLKLSRFKFVCPSQGSSYSPQG
jgi:hypothetical protein